MIVGNVTDKKSIYNRECSMIGDFSHTTNEFSKCFDGERKANGSICCQLVRGNARLTAILHGQDRSRWQITILTIQVAQCACA